MINSELFINGTLIKRYKRFLADIELESGELITAHCPNSGSMKSCWEPGWKVLLTYHDNPKRKLKYTWEYVHNGNAWICVNTQRANEVAYDLLKSHQIPEISGYSEVKREVTYGTGSRIDFLLSAKQKEGQETGRGPGHESQLIYVEVKSVTYLGEDGALQFPDAVTARGQKHLKELMNVVQQGHRGVMLYMIMRGDGDGFHAASHIDPTYAQLLDQAKASGVEIVVHPADLTGLY
jgi:sugar fermentation stimulation protein A